MREQVVNSYRLPTSRALRQVIANGVLKVQRATLVASLFLIVLQQVAGPIGPTAAWQSFATHVQNLARSFR